jgi:hypothetical protein
VTLTLKIERLSGLGKLTGVQVTVDSTTLLNSKQPGYQMSSPKTECNKLLIISLLNPIKKKALKQKSQA